MRKIALLTLIICLLSGKINAQNHPEVITNIDSLFEVTNVQYIDVTLYVEKIFPKQNTKDTSYRNYGSHYRYDAVGNLILEAVEQRGLIMFVYYKYDPNGNRTERISASWIEKPSGGKWISPVAKKDINKYEDFFILIAKLMK